MKLHVGIFFLAVNSANVIESSISLSDAAENTKIAVAKHKKEIVDKQTASSSKSKAEEGGDEKEAEKPVADATKDNQRLEKVLENQQNSGNTSLSVKPDKVSTAPQPNEETVAKAKTNSAVAVAEDKLTRKPPTNVKQVVDAEDDIVAQLEKISAMSSANNEGTLFFISKNLI